MHDAVCDECGRNCQVPFRPSGDKPIYCSDCFEKKGGRESNRPSWRGSGRPNVDVSDRSTSQLIEKIEILNTKLETIIKLLSSTGEKKLAKAKGWTEKKRKSKPKKRAKTKVYSSVKNKPSDK